MVIVLIVGAVALCAGLSAALGAALSWRREIHRIPEAADIAPDPHR